MRRSCRLLVRSCDRVLLFIYQMFPTATNTKLSEVCTRLLMLTYIFLTKLHHNGKRPPLATKICEKYFYEWWHSPKPSDYFLYFLHFCTKFCFNVFFRIEKILTTKAVTSGFPGECYVNLVVSYHNNWSCDSLQLLYVSHKNKPVFCINGAVVFFVQQRRTKAFTYENIFRHLLGQVTVASQW